MLTTGAGIVVRRTKPSDAEGLASIFLQSWQHTYAGIIPAIQLQALMRQRGVRWWRQAIRNEAQLSVLESHGELAGYATCGKARQAGRYKGEIYELYFAPSFQGLGFGQHLFEACRSQLDNSGLDGLIVWALEENTHACEFYHRCGGRRIGRTTERFGHVVLQKVAFGWQ